jgi:GNAT superfamily N-acetyltransferase
VSDEPVISFRPGTEADALCLSVLATQVFLDTYATEGIRAAIGHEVLEQLSTPAVSAMLATPGMRFILAERAGHLVGFAQLTLDAVHELMPHPPAAELNRLYVQERFTGRGLGKALLARAETLARAEGASTMWLTAWVGNARALAFYPRCGYQDFGPTIYEFRGEQHGNRLFAKALDA